MIKFFTYIVSLFLLISLDTNAAVPSWEIVPKESSIIFTATQNGSPVSGQFKSFTGEINFNPAELRASSAQVTVDMGSVSTSYKDIQNALKAPEWFDAKLFPQAIFKTSGFTKINNNTYQANGTLTIRDKTVPIVLNFTLDEYTQTKAHVTGSTVLMRTTFGVGSGEWSKTDDIKDEVKVEFTLSAVKKI